MILKDHLLQTQETFISKSRESRRNTRRPIEMKKEILEKLKHKKKVYKRRKQEQVDWKEYRDAA